ncbi:insulinoma-associated protein 2 [Chiroxiphia lanceolata]|uniref:insulinoma-associated protein 2 n=1 Tax=Chiroxiphia lanceolata TaxID=296741 RepID=UPI0013CEC8E5|nr:insulinoma-associated protein 2 [Chiroxiphia lanceolata]
MPRGFLVKRSRRPGGSYRARPREQDPDRDPPPAPPPPPPPPPPPTAGDSPTARQGAEEEEEEGEEEEGAAAAACPATWPPGGGCSGPGVTQPEGPAAWGATGPCSVAGPRAALFERCLSSPASAESFPLAASFPPAEKLLLQPRTPLPAPPPPPVPALKRPSRAKTPAKKGKATRKLSFADEVTTSPVLGLRIKEEGPEGRPGPPAGRTPLGEFICQLCKEQYADPLALAQHRCSRIVRVEYRCPECHKIFSCPANLASHRRWHKPRPGPSADGAAASPPGKENSPERRLRGPAAPPPQPPPPTRQHRGGADSAGGAPAAPGPGPGLGPAHSGAPGPGGEAFACPCCQKRFRRQAYLRKHLGTHGAARPAAFGPPERGPLAFACHLCGARFPSADIRDKHRLWHAVREELLLPPPPPASVPEGGAAGGERQGFPCKHCPATFFSAPGLARHASKCHPPESRQVLLLQVPVRPGC